MRHSTALVAAVLAIAAQPAGAEPLKTMDEVGAVIRQCWKPPADSEGSSVTLRFSFKRDGTLIGPPKPSDIDVEGDADKKKAYVQAATEALQKCLPLSFAPKLADGIGGNVFTMRFASPSP